MHTGIYSFELILRKAVTIIKQYPKKITSLEEARCIKGIGAKIATKIWEIINTGKLRQAEFALTDSTSQAFQTFGKIWGAGPTSVAKWISKGYRTLDDLNQKDAPMTQQQKIGLKYYYVIYHHTYKIGLSGTYSTQ